MIKENEVILKLQNRFNLNITILDTLLKRPKSVVLKIKMGKKLYVLKIKPSIQKDELKTLWIDEIASKGINIPRIIYSEEGFHLMEYIDGVTLKDYLNLGRDLEQEESMIYRDMGSYLKEMHNSIKINCLKDEEKHFNFKITQLSEYIKTIEQQLPKGLEFNMKSLHDIKRHISIEKYIPKISHGDFHNFNNILIEKTEDSYKFSCLVDYDSLRIDNIGYDLVQILMFISKGISKNKYKFLKGYLNGLDLQERLNVIKSIELDYLFINLEEIVRLIEDLNEESLNDYEMGTLIHYLNEIGEINEYLTNNKSKLFIDKYIKEVGSFV